MNFNWITLIRSKYWSQRNVLINNKLYLRGLFEQKWNQNNINVLYLFLAKSSKIIRSRIFKTIFSYHFLRNLFSENSLILISRKYTSSVIKKAYISYSIKILISTYRNVVFNYLNKDNLFVLKNEFKTTVLWIIIKRQNRT